MFYSEGILRTLSPGDSISSNPERTAPRRCKRSQVTPKCVKEQAVWTTKDHCSLRKTRYLKLRNLVIVYVWEEARVWTHWNHSSYASQLSGASLLCFTIGSGCSLIPVLFSFLVVLENWTHWWLWHLCLLTWLEILHFSLLILKKKCFHLPCMVDIIEHRGVKRYHKPASHHFLPYIIQLGKNCPVPASMHAKPLQSCPTLWPHGL